MSVFLARMSFPRDSALPRDEMVLTPHYDSVDAQGLANALKAKLTANVHIGATNPFKIKIYDAQAPPPSYPLAEAAQTGTPGTAVAPREIALCLSYYSGYNRPTSRGRLYLPGFLFGGAPGPRPDATQRQNAIDFGKMLGEGLPANTWWVVYSRKLNQRYHVTNIWVDDEWDVLRSRGLRGTARTEAAIAG